MAAEFLRPRAGERDLANGRRGLAFLELQRPPAESEDRPAERDRPGGDHAHLHARIRQGGDVGAERTQPFPLQAGFSVDQQGRPDLDDDAAMGGEGAGHGRLVILSRVTPPDPATVRPLRLERLRRASPR